MTLDILQSAGFGLATGAIAFLVFPLFFILLVLCGMVSITVKDEGKDFFTFKRFVWWIFRSLAGAIAFAALLEYTPLIPWWNSLDFDHDAALSTFKLGSGIVGVIAGFALAFLLHKPIDGLFRTKKKAIAGGASDDAVTVQD
jgi:hypothetical protein